MRRKNLFLSLSPNKRNDKVGIYEGPSIAIFGTVFIVAYTFAHSYDNYKVTGRKDRGVGKPADLIGKKIGTPAIIGPLFFINAYLIEHGIDPSAVKMVDFAPKDLPGALEKGKVDAIVIWEPYASMAMKALPDKAVKLPVSELYKQTFNLAAMRSYAKGHPELLKKVLKAVDRAITFIKQNRTESIAVMTKSLKPEEDLLVSIQDDLMFELSLEHSLLTILEDEARWAIANKFTDKAKVPNYLGYFYLDAMKAVKCRRYRKRPQKRYFGTGQRRDKDGPLP
jgi:NitT/TauT family transport system substrate-binding protein